MSDPQADTPQPAAQDAAEKPAAAAAEDPVAALQREIEQLRDRNLRLMAELQNQQKRAAREKAEALRYAEADLARDLLLVVDDLERTQQSARTAPDVATVAEGVRIVYEQLRKILTQRGIRPIEAVGKPFDPTYHEALTQQPSDEHPAGTVMQELERGWIMHERVLRPARVIVSTGPALVPAGPEGNDGEVR